MKSYTTLRNLYGKLTNNETAANLTLGDEFMNDGIREIINMPYQWDFTETSTTDSTVASQQFYDIPYNSEKIIAVTITVGGTTYSPSEAKNRQHWNLLNETSDTSDVPEYFYIYEDSIGFYPTPATSSNTINIYYKKNVRDLSNADYTTGTITLTNGDETVAGSGTTFTAAMVGRFLKGNLNGYWYEIASFTSATSIELKKKFVGTTAASLAYTIGEMPVLPEGFHKLPVWYAVAEYWDQNNEPNRAERYWQKYQGGIQKLIEDHSMKSTDVSISRRQNTINPNNYIAL